ncbi:MoxR family ATPase [Mycolicibacterium sp. P9-64]|uniref:AAA family ATPase n=1 Tax=Mycolicibacterium sp. P9-64 TaxID=2024612 RepID=UPI0011EE80A9|nr:MoxR family ATPase [Mycolicibacterium sp. P9-64]KAA0085656.1 MoxR family ATPase [Mycolicibacterium sp. P9-64]
MSQPFSTIEEVQEALVGEGYIADERLATTIFLQTRLDKPVLIEGPAGVGKTELAKALATATGRRLLRLQCYEGQDETKALYEWDYGKQLLYTQILREKIGQLVADARDLDEAVDRIGEQESVFFSDRFLASRPLLEAVRSDEPVVLLIDEIDRADEALEAVLLELLGEYQVSVPEIGTFTAKHAPYVILTSNNTRDLAAALKRRCLHLFLDYPSAERELEIVRSKDTGLTDALAAQLVEVVRGLRDLDLRKAPSISETIDWARTLAVLGVDELSAKVLSDTISVVIKYDKDVRKSLEALPRLIDPNAKVPDTLHNGHAHAHGHGHSHDHGHAEPPSLRSPHAEPPSLRSPHAEPPSLRSPQPAPERDGKAAREAKDKPGRFSNGYYGTPKVPSPSRRRPF